MRLKLMGSLSLIVILFGLSFVLAQDPGDEELRGAFLSSREEKSGASKKPPRRRTARRSPTPKPIDTANANTKDPTSKNTPTPDTPAETALALGYTLFVRDSNGDAVRVDPSEEFHTGEKVRISLEPNVDGYLYVFHKEGEGEPRMIYPDWRLASGKNEVEAHVPYEVPSGFEKDERLRWFTFDANPATEHLYIVITRDPLPAVPVGEALVTFCATNKTKCPWQPSTEAWGRIQEALKAEVKVAAQTDFGQPQSDKERVATTRGLGLDQSAPAPSVIRMSASTSAPVLVTVLDLVHK